MKTQEQAAKSATTGRNVFRYPIGDTMLFTGATPDKYESGLLYLAERLETGVYVVVAQDGAYNTSGPYYRVTALGTDVWVHEDDLHPVDVMTLINLARGQLAQP